jgi:hypothetical protein
MSFCVVQFAAYSARVKGFARLNDKTAKLILIMRRFLAVLLLALLPLHVSLAAVVPYCQHESFAGASHIGHHEHEHSAHLVDREQAGATNLAGIDTDCGTCHAGCASAMLAASQQLAITTGAINIAEQRMLIDQRPLARPERPKWIARV